ncbi:inner membrane protein YhjD [Actinoplanes philippinensis]|uniref:Membrane protein n=1 Tax=Actinoplanes philippinensis TaxID=35752 RepID=A0A1I2J6R2_9ACTN|nr:YihY/virulence factor BrkB family protein [Actinoplanes philippinensis]GIE79443.1 inner membrane protein YhjD [Actinoplanes philippinensis]SFF50214.1 membrane protein [Actinoplanes philippinensis]
MNPIDRAYDATAARILAVRYRSPYFDHFCRAILRYESVQGGRLAAAIAYYGFFAVFALLLIGYSIFGWLLTANVELLDLVRDFLHQNLPFLDIQAILESKASVGIVGLIGLTFTGIGWVEAIRSSQRLIWRVREQPGYIGVRQAVDLLVLVGLLLLLALSQLAVYGLETLLHWLAGGGFATTLSVVSWVLTLAVNMLLAAALLAAVPRLRMTARRMTPPVLQVGIGIMLLNTVGKSFVGLVERNPAYGLVGSAVGALVYLYVFNQLLLFGASWAATSPHGRVVDLSADDKTAPVGQNIWIRHDRPR